MAVMNIIQALNLTLHQEFARDSRLLTFGEDAGAFGGVFRVTSGLQEKFGEERCFDTPLCEQGIIGFGIGIAQKGLKPICEIQFADYIFPAYDQIVNELAKMRYRTGNQYAAPLVIRTPYGGGIHGGHYHSQSPEAQFLHTPGINIVFVSGPYDAKGLLTTAIRSQDPVIIFEPKRLYRSMKEEVPVEDYSIPFGVAAIDRIGSDVTLIGWGAQHHQNLEAARQLKDNHGVEAEVINLRTLNPLDINTVVTSVAKTGRCVVAHEAPKTQGFGAELAAQISEKCFLHLEAPVNRCCGLDTPYQTSSEAMNNISSAFRQGKHLIMRITEDAKKAEFTVPKERFINAKDEIAHLTHDMHSLIVALWDGLKLPHVGRDPYLEFINKFLQPDPRERISVDEALEELKRQFPETFNSRE